MSSNDPPSSLNAPVPLIRMSRRRWRSLQRQLRIRGRGIRESGAFLLGAVTTSAKPERGRQVQRIVYYDDLDANCLTGGISLAGSAFDKLWRICNQLGLSVIADIHTHPTANVEQSYVDASNPMIGIVGHVALIVPSYAENQVSSSSVGAYIYKGNHEWTEWSSSTVPAVFLSLTELRGLHRFRVRMHLIMGKLVSPNTRNTENSGSR
jgi:hypothetical protein